MGWFSRRAKKVMRFAQKRHAVPLNKARKIDDRLQAALIEIQNKQKHTTNSEGVQLQAALRNFYNRVTAIKSVERDLVSMAEDVAANERVINQLIKLKDFTSETWALLKMDFADIIGDFKKIKKTWDLSKKEGKLRAYIVQQEKDLKEIILKLEVAAEAEHIGIQKGDSKGIGADIDVKLGGGVTLEDSIVNAKRLLAQVLAAKAASKIKSTVGVELALFWENLTKKLEIVELSPIEFLDNKKHKRDIEEIRKLIDLELASIMMAMKELNDELELFSNMGVEILPKARKRRLVRSIQQLAMEQ